MKIIVPILSIVLACSMGSKTHAAGETPAAASFSGTVVETANAGSYTYVQIDTGKEKVWAAAPQFPVKVGDKASFANGMAMKNYESKNLKRTFDTVYFTGAIEVGGSTAAPMGKGMGMNPHGPGGAADPHAKMRAKTPPITIDFAGLKKPEGGMTVGEVMALKSSWGNKPVALRGKVVKYNTMIMGKNWMHVQDGTGASGANDLTVTTMATAKVGDTVLVQGKLTFEKDFGAGYKYDIVMEDAKVTVEPAK